MRNTTTWVTHPRQTFCFLSVVRICLKKEMQTYLWCRSLCAAWWVVRRSPTGWTGWWGSGPISLQEPTGDSESVSHREKDPPPVKTQYIRLRSDYMTQKCFYQQLLSVGLFSQSHRPCESNTLERNRLETQQIKEKILNQLGKAESITWLHKPWIYWVILCGYKFYFTSHQFQILITFYSQ